MTAREKFVLQAQAYRDGTGGHRCLAPHLSPEKRGVGVVLG
jgi:hypothetical protein